eukprot:scaffold175723_cov40-Attheya_sp.AAC.2
MSLACLIQKRLISAAKMEKILFGLCRLEAWRVRDQVGESRTVVFTLPGQSCTSALLPLLQKAFPCERHVFAYDGCINSVSRGLAIRKQPEHCQRVAPVVTDVDLLTTEIMSMPRAVSATCPLSSAVVAQHSGLRDELGKIPGNHADTVEAWMSSVDTFLSMKENEKENDYLPFVLRMGFLMGATGTLGNGAKDVSDLSLMNLLQYVTGSRSRPIREEIVDAARQVLLEVQSSCIETVKGFNNFSEAQTSAIEDCVFVHKSILIGDKTLVDTVQPMKEWSLKAAKKMTGCSCCAPEEEEDEDEDEEEETSESKTSTSGGALDMSVPG